MCTPDPWPTPLEKVEADDEGTAHGMRANITLVFDSGARLSLCGVDGVATLVASK
jgi:hypothetical protein